MGPRAVSSKVSPSCFVVASLFISALAAYPISRIVGALFIAAMLALIAALLFFLREVFVATRSLRIGRH